MIGSSWAIIFIFLFAGVTLFFSANGIALNSFSLTKLQEAFKTVKKQNPEEMAQKLAEQAEQLTLTCHLYRLIFNMLVLLLLVAVFTNTIETHPYINYLIAFVIAIVIFSAFSVAIPHAWAKYSGEKILCRTYNILVFSAFIVSPFLYIFGLYDGLIRRLAGVAETTLQEQQEEKQEEFLTDLEQQRTEGVLDEEQQHMIEKVLEMNDSTAEQIMTPRTEILALDVNSDIDQVLQMITQAGHTRVPVYQDNIDNIVGLVYAKDLLSQIGKDSKDFKLEDKIRQAYFVPETKPLRALLHEFQSRKQHIAIVLDEYGGTAGIVTLEDILEELVGEISDEYEEETAEPIRKISPDTIEIDARISVSDLNDEIEIELPEDEDYETLGGFVLSRLGYIPKTGETFDYQDMKFTIVSAESRKIKRIRIQKPDNAAT